MDDRPVWLAQRVFHQFADRPGGLVDGRALSALVEHVDKAAEKRIDWLGVVLLALAIGSLLLALELAERIGFISLAFGSGALLFLSLGAAFVVHQRRSSAPVIPPDLFAIPVVRQLSLLATLAGCGLFVLVFYSPLLLQAGFSYSPAEAGWLVMPLMVCVTVGSIINGRLIPRVKRPEGLFAKGVLALVLALLGLCVASSATPHWLLWGVFALCGLAFGFQLPNLTIQMQASVEPRHVGIASALIQTLRTLGGLLGASVAGLVVSLVFAHGSARLLAEQQIDRQEVRHLFESPQVLLRAGEQDGVAELGIRFGFDAPALLNAARFELIDGIRAAFMLCLILAIISYGTGRTLPPYVGKRQP
jgi:MFS family permease